ncbi:MAG TPA: class I SAM-dependent methyltransferase [Bacillota bacterium]|nr:class I SAM-dependent methyltransferase [Bacillota bacterium]
MTAFNWQKQSEQTWDEGAANWSERSANMWNHGSRKKIIPFIEQHLAQGANMLDVGCGDGYGTYRLSKSGYQVTGVDLSGEMIARAKERLRGEPISLIQGNVLQLPFENNHFDGVMAINVLEWTEVPAQALIELHRILKKDGLMFVGILGPTAGPRANSYRRVYGEEVVCNTMMPWEFQQLALEHGLEYVEGFGVHKRGVQIDGQQLPLELKQALSFMWVFMLRKLK